MYIVIKGKRLVIGAAAFLAVAVIFFSAINPVDSIVPASVTNWGLGFRKEGTPPSGNATSEYLAKYNAFYLGDKAQKKIYLTFDAGYENGYTPVILDILKKNEVKAAFFLVGNYIKTSPELVKRMCDEGHIVGNHTYHHPDMSKISDLESFKIELETLEQLYKQTTGQDIPRFYRPPQGKYSQNNLAQANQLGYKTVFWSLAYVDWYVDNQPTKQQAFDKLLPRIHPGAVVLLHSTSKTNSEILDELITKWKNEGYTFGTLNEFNT